MQGPYPSSDAHIQAADLYLLDPARETYAVRYPGLLVGVIAVSGLAAFAVVGFLGYPTDADGIYTIFHPAWALFLWFGALILAVQWSIFRHAGATRWRWQTLIVTFLSIVTVAAGYSKPEALTTLLNRMTDILNVLGISVERGRLLWNLANFGILALYVLDRAVLWVKGERAGYRGVLAELDGLGADRSVLATSRPTTWELISQDLFAGAALSLLLGSLFQTSVFNFLKVHVAGAPVDTCAVSWATGTCRLGNLHNPPTLTFIDWALAFFAVAASALVLSIGLVIKIFFQRSEEGAETVARAVAETLLAALNPIDIFVRNLRNVLWPSLIVIGVVGAATCARYIRLYLHLLSDRQSCNGAITCPDLREFASYLSSSLDAEQFEHLSPALGMLFLALAIVGGVGGTLAIISSARILVSDQRISGRLFSNWFWFLVAIVRQLLLMFWVPSLGLSALMIALQHVNLTMRAPFPQPGVSTTISFVYFAVMLSAHFLWDRRRPPERRIKLVPSGRTSSSME